MATGKSSKFEVRSSKYGGGGDADATEAAVVPVTDPVPVLLSAAKDPRQPLRSPECPAGSPPPCHPDVYDLRKCKEAWVERTIASDIRGAGAEHGTKALQEVISDVVEYERLGLPLRNLAQEVISGLLIVRA